MILTHRGVAQLVARCVRVAEALGSSPSAPTETHFGSTEVSLLFLGDFSLLYLSLC